jgi:CRISPR/Cas system-associated exonuclease Cas4 (RecB family)
MKSLKKSRGILLYENKNNHELLALPVEIKPEYIKWMDDAFDWMRATRKAWEDRKLPKKPYRANSKVCKTCPVQKVCATLPVGDIKIEPLGEIEP